MAVPNTIAYYDTTTSTIVKNYSTDPLNQPIGRFNLLDLYCSRQGIG